MLTLPPPPQVYRILLRRTACVQPLSCDEAYLDITGELALMLWQAVCSLQAKQMFGGC